jgi:molecular chaperone GrpE (heat shock protein)
LFRCPLQIHLGLPRAKNWRLKQLTRAANPSHSQKAKVKSDDKSRWMDENAEIERLRAENAQLQEALLRVEARVQQLLG